MKIDTKELAEQIKNAADDPYRTPQSTAGLMQDIAALVVELDARITKQGGEIAALKSRVEALEKWRSESDLRMVLVR